ncbi:hypothetical protein E2C01_050791 [Portunus trituberculatus]|uniref:Uncharacterized protein n=1 Tax=Portunus trituberculatus TaxID=210409 RepID=A0A5B7GGX7_PORTR|nr:hypothetical protein [Portunus trituberculatus]
MAGHTGRWPRPEVTLTASRRRGQGLSLWCGREARSWPAAATNPHSLGGLRYFRHVARQQVRLPQCFLDTITNTGCTEGRGWTPLFVHNITDEEVLGAAHEEAQRHNN